MQEDEFQVLWETCAPGLTAPKDRLTSPLKTRTPLLTRGSNQRVQQFSLKVHYKGCSAPEKPHTDHTGTTTLSEPGPKFRQVSKLVLPKAFRSYLEYCHLHEASWLLSQ